MIQIRHRKLKSNRFSVVLAYLWGALITALMYEYAPHLPKTLWSWIPMYGIAFILYIITTEPT